MRLTVLASSRRTSGSLGISTTPSSNSSSPLGCHCKRRVQRFRQAGANDDAAIDSLDGVIKEIRNTIFRLPGRTEEATGTSRRDAAPRRQVPRRNSDWFHVVAFDGAIDLVIPEAVTAHLLQVFGEGLSNIARHANASNVDAVVAIDDGWLTFSLVDDGIGIAEGPKGGNGLRNMETRAANLGGVCTVSRRDPNGTIVEWRVPLSS